jgi:hypothetical protein
MQDIGIYTKNDRSRDDPCLVNFQSPKFTTKYRIPVYIYSYVAYLPLGTYSSCFSYKITTNVSAVGKPIVYIHPIFPKTCPVP